MSETAGVEERTSRGVGRFNLYHPDFLLLIVDLMGAFVFAVEGGLAAIRSDLDILGLLVIAFATALGGGMIRDVLIGAIPPNSIRDWRYPATALLGGGAVFFCFRLIQEVPPNLLITLDAAGLALCAIAGAGKAVEFGINPLLAVMMGAVTGVGGGTIRDILLNRVPGVLRSDVYAAAALAGALVVVVGLRFKVPRWVVMTAGAVVCFVLRMVAVWQHWNLPKMIAAP
ncbi:MAG: trimeric intracellular cation channel family protein [Edaphobacter sp.]|uniref:trimeric intracellular cation channel family protein n=1 Tax=Edaphobacter sp. TaxID=1934404 RepID=UPI002386F276|nr:trimeric intracellular cation channel family protein [Edaphobacter sp.]MDE1175518.1 trimeric intracellular cation channel family protein [Edaphobacter sp.]